MRCSLIIGTLCVIVSMPVAAHAETQTQSWFVSHPAARARVNAICMDNPGSAAHNANCINAAAADETAAMDRMIGRIGNVPTLIDQCASMPPLFQIVNHCGPAGGGKR